MRRAAALALGLFAALASTRAGASELSWHGAPNCDEQDRLLFQIEQALGTPLAQAAALKFTVTLERAQGPLSARLSVSSLSGASSEIKERVLTATDCSKLVDTLAVAVALTLGAAEPGATQAAANVSASDAAGLAAESRPPAASPPSAPGIDPTAANDDPRSSGPHWGVLALVVSDVGSLPATGIGSALGLVLGWERLELRLMGTLFFDQQIDLPAFEGANAHAEFELAFGTALACMNVLGSADAGFRLPLCAGGELGRLAGAGRGVLNADRHGVPWIAPVLEGGLFRPIPGTQLRVGALLSAAVPLNRDEFLLDGVGPLHRPGRVVARASLGLDVQFE